jgi:methionyl-tRNA formyltransferase
MRVAFLGNDRRSVPSLEAVARSSHEVVLVVCRPPTPAGRGGRPTPAPTAGAARELGLPLVETRTVKEGDGWGRLEDSSPDALAVVAYGEILPPHVLSLPRVAPVNLHFSLLPALRGADPVRRALLAGLRRTGVTVIRMDEGMDTGPILLQETVEVADHDDAGSLGSRLAELGGELLVRALDGLDAGTIRERPQDPSGATLAPKLDPDEEWIDWSEDAEAVWRRVRALAPDPAARARFADKLVKVLGVTPAEGIGEPGAVLQADPLTVAAGRDAVVLDRVIPEGRRPMSGADFARGRRIQPGQRFG